MGMKLYYHSKKDADQYKKFEADGTYWIAFISEEDGFCWSLRLEEKNTSPPYPKIENVVGFYKVGGAYHAHYKFRFGHTGKFKPLPWLSSDKSVYTEFLIFEE